MHKLQNTLYITTQGSYLHKERETLVIEQTVAQGAKKWRNCRCMPSAIFFCFGNVLVSPFLMGFCGENNVNLAFFTGIWPLSRAFAGAAERQCVAAPRPIACPKAIRCRLRAILLPPKSSLPNACCSAANAITASMARFRRPLAHLNFSLQQLQRARYVGLNPRHRRRCRRPLFRRIPTSAHRKERFHL